MEGVDPTVTIVILALAVLVLVLWIRAEVSAERRNLFDALDDRLGERTVLWRGMEDAMRALDSDWDEDEWDGLSADEAAQELTRAARMVADLAERP